ncbi:MAG: hypothetical protein M3Q48_02730 [Actinomycetota bacterium]|nr:hypothetical protein [Actinomycetota bacterium]
MVSRDERRVIVEGLAAYAVTMTEMGADEQDVRAKLASELQRFGVDDPVGVLRDSAAAITAAPQPPDETAERLERAQPIRELFGLPSPGEQLAATLRAREWVQRLAEDIETASE